MTNPAKPTRPSTRPVRHPSSPGRVGAAACSPPLRRPWTTSRPCWPSGGTPPRTGSGTWAASGRYPSRRHGAARQHPRPPRLAGQRLPAATRMGALGQTPRLNLGCRSSPGARSCAAPVSTCSPNPRPSGPQLPPRSPGDGQRAATRVPWWKRTCQRPSSPRTHSELRRDGRGPVTVNVPWTTARTRRTRAVPHRNRSHPRGHRDREPPGQEQPRSVGADRAAQELSSTAAPASSAGASWTARIRLLTVSPP